MSGGAAILKQPTPVQTLILGSYFYLLNLFRWAFEKTLHAGLVGEIALGIIYGTPLAGILTNEWEETLWQVGYIGLMLIVFEGTPALTMQHRC